MALPVSSEWPSTFGEEIMYDSESEIFILQAVPPAVIDDQERFPETHKLIASAVGNCFHARGTNDLGMIEIWIADDGTDTSDACADSVWIEREFLTPPKTEPPNKTSHSSPDRSESK